MGKPSYLETMTNFQEKRNLIVDRIDPLFEPIIKEWAAHVYGQFNKGLVPLFITGSGMSLPEVPDLVEIVKELKQKYEDIKEKIIDPELKGNIDSLFQMWNEHKNKDRSVIGRILNTFQDDKKLYPAWENLNTWLLRDKVLKAEPSESHDILSKLYEGVGAICLTLNFDGLLVKKLRAKGKTAFSIPDKDECEKFFLRLESSREFIEIQARGDILYLKCQGSGEKKGYCPEKDGKPRPLWMYFPTDIPKEKLYEYFSKCPSCNGNRISYLSFPGSYEKEKDMQKILAVVWKYLAFRVSCVTVIGMSGSWDPLIIAFVGDLLKEREIPLLVIDIEPDQSYLVRELVMPVTVNSVALKCKHADFTISFYENIKKCDKISPAIEPLTTTIKWHDGYWDKDNIIKDSSISKKINTGISKFEDNLLEKMIDNYCLDKYAQLGLKSRWLGIQHNRYHNRLCHSYGVMKIASYLYDKVTDDFGYKKESEKRFLRIAALLHDIGHLPFAHLIEEIFQELNWKPAKYKESFSHSLNTAKNIGEMFILHPHLEEELSHLGYSKDDLIRLINGEFGVGLLDAIINSPIDADKIDYIFRDTSSTEKRILLSPEQFLRDIVSGMSITPERFLAFSGISAKAAVELLQTRRFLYRNLYLRPGIRFLENAVKLIIITYFVHWIKLQNDNIMQIRESFSDLGHYKIQCCIEELKRLVKEVKGESSNEKIELELEIVRVMKNHIIINRLLNRRMNDALEYCFEKIEETKNEDKLKELEAKIVYFRSQDLKEISEMGVSRYREAAKACMLRLPGAILIDIIESPKFLSIADSRKKRERSDGTNTHSECIIIPSGDYITWYPGQKANASLLDSLSKKEEKVAAVYVYPITKDESYAAHAKNLFKKLLEEEGIPEVE